MNLVLETPRLRMTPLCADDAAFMLAVLNAPGFLENIGDRGVRTAAAARAYLEAGPVACWAEHGYGMMRVSLRETGEGVGVCGLVRREGLEDPDIGYAFLEPYWGRGYAYEAAEAAIRDARERLGTPRIVAITKPVNPGAIRVLEKLGLRFVRMIRLPGHDEESRFFSDAAP